MCSSDLAVFSDSWELVISFNGISTVYNKPLSALDLQTNYFKVVVGGEVVKYKNLSLNQKQQIDKTFPKINRELVAELHINEKHILNKDKYTTTYNHINNFVRQHLLTSEFQGKHAVKNGTQLSECHPRGDYSDRKSVV